MALYTPSVRARAMATRRPLARSQAKKKRLGPAIRRRTSSLVRALLHHAERRSAIKSSKRSAGTPVVRT
jgi:hypothetical protein